MRQVRTAQLTHQPVEQVDRACLVVPHRPAMVKMVAQDQAAATSSRLVAVRGGTVVAPAKALVERVVKVALVGTGSLTLRLGFMSRPVGMADREVQPDRDRLGLQATVDLVAPDGEMVGLELATSTRKLGKGVPAVREETGRFLDCQGNRARRGRKHTAQGAVMARRVVFARYRPKMCSLIGGYG